MGLKYFIKSNFYGTIVWLLNAAACIKRNSSPQVAIAKIGLEKQPHFHKATWAQSTILFQLTAEPHHYN
jgi:hypothetical protein